MVLFFSPGRGGRRDSPYAARAWEKRAGGVILASTMSQRRDHIHRHYTPRVHPERDSYDILDWGSAATQCARFQVLADLLRDTPALAGLPRGPRLLDAGCGLADLRPFLESRGQRVRYVGADLTPAILKEARRRQPDADLVLTDLFAAPPFFPETFDVVFASGIFNLNLGNNDAFVQRAVPALARLAAGCVVANFLHAGAPVKHAHCHYYEPVPLMAALAGAGRRIDCREGYLDHDFTLVVWR
jgi:SAM-dependent methyltransferase